MGVHYVLRIGRENAMQVFVWEWGLTVLQFSGCSAVVFVNFVLSWDASFLSTRVMSVHDASTFLELSWRSNSRCA